MAPGKYPYRAIFSVPATESDDIGNQVGTRAEIGRAWVSVTPLSAREHLLGGERSTSSHKVALRRPSFAIPNTAVLTIGERVFEVEAPLDAPNSAEILLMCAEKRA